MIHLLAAEGGYGARELRWLMRRQPAHEMSAAQCIPAQEPARIPLDPTARCALRIIEVLLTDLHVRQPPMCLTERRVECNCALEVCYAFVEHVAAPRRDVNGGQHAAQPRVRECVLRVGDDGSAKMF